MRTSPPYPACDAARLATRPPYERPPATVSSDAGTAASHAPTARSACPLGMSIARADTPSRVSASTYGRMLAAPPDAPGARTTSGDIGASMEEMTGRLYRSVKT
ncbi:MAG: hypothetical protein ABR509_05430 [Candidatus Limnocylindria bacterium]